jgi:hypothetical protein
VSGLEYSNASGRGLVPFFAKGKALMSRLYSEVGEQWLPNSVFRGVRANRRPRRASLACLTCHGRSHSSTQGNTPTRTVFKSFPGLLLTSTLPIPTNVFNENPRNGSQLLSTRDPLSVHTTTVNFRKFVSRVGPFFWLQDGIEEIVNWKKGWKVTVMWMIAYRFLCQLVSPHVLQTTN